VSSGLIEDKKEASSKKSVSEKSSESFEEEDSNGK